MGLPQRKLTGSPVLAQLALMFLQRFENRSFCKKLRRHHFGFDKIYSSFFTPHENYGTACVRLGQLFDDLSRAQNLGKVAVQVCRRCLRKLLC